MEYEPSRMGRIRLWQLLLFKTSPGETAHVNTIARFLALPPHSGEGLGRPADERPGDRSWLVSADYFIKPAITDCSV